MDTVAWLGVAAAAGLAALITYLSMRLRASAVRDQAAQAESERWSGIVDGYQRQLSEVETLRTTLKDREAQLEDELSRLAQLDPESARRLYLAKMEESFQDDARRKLKEWQTMSAAEVDQIAHERLLNVMERTAASRVSQATTVAVPLPNEEMKGRLIGREGRNIRSFEQVTGVDLIIDDTPETVVISSFDPVRRETARLTLVNMMLDGRIHPVRIEELFQRAAEEVERMVLESGSSAAESLGIRDLQPEVTAALGQLRFRSSLAQNVLDHSVETAQIARLLCQEIGMDPAAAVRASLLHDIGKGLSSEWDGPHAIAGMKFLTRFGESAEVCHAVGAHHHDIEPESLAATLVIVADSLSASRPGARRESLESFIHRVEDLEKIGKSFPGVEQCFAIQSGRELRVIVVPDQVDEVACKKLAMDISQKVATSAESFGRVKVTVIRETRVSETTQ